MVDDISRTGILISKRVFFTVDNIMYRDFHMLHLSQAGSVSCARRAGPILPTIDTEAGGGTNTGFHFFSCPQTAQ